MSLLSLKNKLPLAGAAETIVCMQRTVSVSWEVATPFLSESEEKLC